jgi:hypothetical protein
LAVTAFQNKLNFSPGMLDQDLDSPGFSEKNRIAGCPDFEMEGLTIFKLSSMQCLDAQYELRSKQS